MRIGLDTNVLAYAEGTNGDSKREQTLEILGSRRVPYEKDGSCRQLSRSSKR